MSNSDTGIDEFEGEESMEPGNSSGPLYPNANVKVDRAQFSVFELKRKFDRKQLIVDPDFQRETLWSDKQKSELIESILMGIPLPLIYLTENKAGDLIVVDGRQRLTTLFDFLDNEYKLANLKILSDLNGISFKKLESKYQSSIEDYQLIAHVIKPPTSDQVKFDIFDRVNRGGTRLNNQEMRNALYQGPATILLKTLAQTEEFHKATDNSIAGKRMKDRYVILRFISFYIWRHNLYPSSHERIEYKSGIDDFLGKHMELLNKLPEDILKDLSMKFKKSMTNALKVFGSESFRLPAEDSKMKRRPVNMALFESLSYLLSGIDVNDEISHKLTEAFSEKLSDEVFYRSLTYVIDSNKAVATRFDAMDSIMDQVLL